ncbi:unnamed protein product [Calicophoron daubneyi]|uniref:Gelsolin-like domain-containing protein n=1 Tax=Calicophoron daubneyi TaxID=300641 RepID=A0AAV2T6K7_CALDB
MEEEEYKWKDTNLELVGSDEDRAVKKAAAETEEAWQPVRSVQSSVLMVWRIKDFALEVVEEDEVGKFYRGDSYIVLKVTKVNDSLSYDIHFWIGKDSTQDEYCTAAYKTVELDAFLDDKAVQHREVDGFESKEFISYFKRLEKLDGGYASGFKHVEPEQYKPRLLVFHGKTMNKVELTEVTFTKRALNSDDVFILDLGKKAYQWNGKASSAGERYQASMFMQALEDERNGRCETVVAEEGDDLSKEFLSHLPDGPVYEKPTQDFSRKAIYRLSDQSGELSLSLVCEEQLSKSVLTENDPYFIDGGHSLFVYVGTGCSRKEKANALARAHEYLKSTPHPFIPITVVNGGQTSKPLEEILE